MSNVLCIRSLQLCKICTLLSYDIDEPPKYTHRMQRVASTDWFQCFEVICSISRHPVDITKEQTINGYAKSQGAIIGLSRNYAAYCRRCKTRHLRAQYVEATSQRTEMSNDEVPIHKDLRTSQIQSSDQDVKS